MLFSKSLLVICFMCSFFIFSKVRFTHFGVSRTSKPGYNILPRNCTNLLLNIVVVAEYDPNYPALRQILRSPPCVDRML